MFRLGVAADLCELCTKLADLRGRILGLLPSIFRVGFGARTHLRRLVEEPLGLAAYTRDLGCGSDAPTGRPLARVALSVGLPADSTPAGIVDHLARARDLSGC